MQPAPPLAVQCASSRAWRWFCAALGAAAATSIAVWAAAHLELDLPLTLALLAAAVAAGLTHGLHVAGPRHAVSISWDGEAWQVDGRRGRPQVMLDLDRWLLLRWLPAERGAVRWLALSCVEPSAALHALRTALYSPAPTLDDDKPRVRASDRADD